MGYGRVRGIVALVVSSLCGHILPATAMDISTQYSLGAQYSDNIGLVPNNEEAAWVGLASATIGLRERTANLTLDALGVFEYRDYRTTLFDDELVASLDARAVWTIDPGHRYWHFEDYYRQADSNPLAPPTPDNRENTNVLSTGPEFHWRLSPYQTAIAGARYGHFWFENNDIDNYRLSAYGRLVHDWRPRTRLSMNAEGTTIKYFAARRVDYDRLDLFGRMDHTLARGMLQVDLGGTLVRRERGEDLDGFLGHASWHLNLNSRSTLEAAVIHEYTDSGHDILATASRDGGVGILDEHISGDVYYNRHAELAYNWYGLRTSIRFAGILRDEDHDADGLDRNVREAYGHLGYYISTNLRLVLFGSYTEEEFREVDVTSKERHIGAGIHYHLNSRWRLTIEGGTTRQTSDDPTLEYKENTGLIRLIYERTPPFTE